jgi:hypothetical protein
MLMGCNTLLRAIVPFLDAVRRGARVAKSFYQYTLLTILKPGLSEPYTPVVSRKNQLPFLRSRKKKENNKSHLVLQWLFTRVEYHGPSANSPRHLQTIVLSMMQEAASAAQMQVSNITLGFPLRPSSLFHYPSPLSRTDPC